MPARLSAMMRRWLPNRKRHALSEHEHSTSLGRFLLQNALVGFAASIVFIAAIIWTDTANLGTLIANSPYGTLAAAVLILMNGFTFAAAQIGFALFGFGRNDDR